MRKNASPSTLPAALLPALLFMGLLAPAVPAAAQRVQLLSPEITFTAKEVFFRQPIHYQAADGTVRSARSALKLILEGEGFYEASTGPFYYLGRRRADAHYTSPDGTEVAVYFYDLAGIGAREELRINLRTDQWLTLKQPFQLEAVRWLEPEVRQRHDLPDLRKTAAPELREGG